MAAPLRIGSRCFIAAPTYKMRGEYLDFLIRNEGYHRPWVYHMPDPKYYDHYLGRIKHGVTQGCFIFDIKTKRLAGVININNILMGSMRMASLGYYGDEEFAGSGHMSEGMRLVLDYSFTTLGLNRLEANIQPENIASRRLVQKLGFRKEGFSPKYLQIGGKWCDHERWAILAEEIE